MKTDFLSINKDSICCFIGHRKINYSDNLFNKTKNIIERLILDKNVYIFLFGSKSQFNSLCYQIVTELKEIYTHLMRINIRAEYQFIDEYYEEYLSSIYEKSFFPEKVSGAGKCSYIKRNQIMIDYSDYCIFYYNENYLPKQRLQKNPLLPSRQTKSGTKIALDYAKSKKKKIFVVT